MKSARKKKQIKFVCKKCGKEAQPNKEESNENWDVIDNKPCECGGQLTIKFE